MPRNRAVPKYSGPHKSGLAFVAYRSAGQLFYRYLGKYGSQESREKYERFVRQWRQAHEPEPPEKTSEFTVTQLIAAHLRHAEHWYVRADGTPTDELGDYKWVYKLLVKHCGEALVDEVRPRDFKAIRQAMIKADLSLGVINQRMGRIRRIFRWGVSEELVEPAVSHALEAVPDLTSGRSSARETQEVLPVEWATVAATLPHLSSDQLRAIVQFCWWVGCRPGEGCRVRGRDIHMAGYVQVGRRRVNLPKGVWAYTCLAKMAHARKREQRVQVYAIGPNAQEVLRPWLRQDPEECLWQPREASGQRHAKEHYTAISLGHAIMAAVKRGKVEPWTANQLRHAAEQRVEAEFGFEAARKVLNHLSVSTTRLYSTRDIVGAAEVQARIG